ncbi:MAG: DUF1801 domain-containing protein [Betaproteobacteria bacterium]|nr:DUF1801 domain-containing protein [Betaproteobacteria bacterium]
MANEPKTRPTDASVQAFISSVADSQRREDCETVCALMEKVTRSKPVMWGPSIVGFGSMPLHYANGKSLDWPLVGFSPRKEALTLYIMAGFEDYAPLMAKLGKHKIGKSCLYVKKLADIDQKVLKQLVEQSVKHLKAMRKPSVRDC